MNKIEQQQFLHIITTRDKRYDGRFYFGVRTTKIFCRPVCPARPKPENIILFNNIYEAQANGYRPCRRCYPDENEASSLVQGTHITVKRALRIIDERLQSTLSIEMLSDLLGVGARHLRRLFEEHIGASPLSVIRTKRLMLASRLLSSTDNRITDVALGCGFSSSRNFNESFKQTFTITPREYRKKFKTPADSTLQFKINLNDPYDWDYMIDFFNRHHTFGVDGVKDRVYYRHFKTSENNRSKFEVAFDSKKCRLLVNFRDLPLSDTYQVLEKIKKMFDVYHNDAFLPTTSKVKTRGIRIPGSYDSFECAVSIILGQLVSIPQAQRTMKLLVSKYGTRLTPKEELYQFPTPLKLSRAKLAGLGLSTNKISAIKTLAKMIHKGELTLDHSCDIEETRDKLLSIKGIGPWSVNMIAMRCLGDINAFAGKDLIIARAIEQNIIDPNSWPSHKGYLNHIIWRDFASKLSKQGKANE
jgi:AraC family transcriptional regulator of adaptative response / DNA-3-methyladenine glycosylase II